MNILLSICTFIVVFIVVLLYVATRKLIQDHQDLHSSKEDETLDLPKTL
jgi:cell division protein FtsL